MKISVAWLREWVNFSLTTEVLAEQLTLAGLEVDAVYPVAGRFDSVIVARVVSTRAHPQADRLTLCMVDAGHGELLQIVCGAANVRADLKVALALNGAQLPGDITIKESKLRGELSQGMLCGASELGLLDTADGIIELPQDAPLSLDLRTYLGLEDEILDIDLTPNRGDCLSILGIARDIAALNHLPLQQPLIPPCAPSSDRTIAVHIEAPKACPLYVGRVLSGINPHAKTPIQISERLKRSGLRPTHPVVDALHYVMLELGQPMHAFDCQQIVGDIHVRYGTPLEKLTVLTGQTCSLDADVLVIADSQQVLALAGIMGGASSGVQAETTDIFLESAFFDPVAIAGVARRFALSSDAAHRFERGVDPAQSLLALEAATLLLQSIVGGQAGPLVVQSLADYPPPPVTIAFKPSQVLRLSGVVVPEEEMAAILTRLGMQLAREAECWQVTIPSYRSDLRLDVDLVEEIIRMFGYDKMPSQPMTTLLRPGTLNDLDQLGTDIMEFLAHRGYRETISYSFVDPQLQRALYPEMTPKSLSNPISAELAEMRLGLWPGLLASMLHNIHRQQAALKLSEIGTIFLNNGLQEQLSCAGLVTGDYGQLRWNEPAGTYDFYDLKGDIEALFASLHYSAIQFVAKEHPALHPGKTAQILYNGQTLGWIGALHPRLSDALDLSAEVILFEINLSSLAKSPAIVYQPISKYPSIRRDLSLLVDTAVKAQDLEDVVRGVVPPPYLKSFYVFDVYTGGNLIQEQKKSMAIGLVLQSDTRTLNDTEVNTIMDDVIHALAENLQALLRSE